MNLAFTLCSNNYLGQAKVLATTYLKYNPEGHFIIGLVDRLSPEIDYKSFAPVQFLTCDELGYQEFEGMKRRYSITEFNTAVKPFYFEYLFNHGFDKVIYLDPDIVVFDTLNDLFDMLNGSDILLTPHTVTAQYKNDIKWQQTFNFVGIYNLGFLALKVTENTRQLLQWWQKRLETICFMVPAEGLFVDQIWANYFTLYFSNSCIVRDPGYNMAHWNFRERTLRLEQGVYWVNQSRLKFFHFSNFKPSKPEVISVYSDYTFAELPVIKGIYQEYLNLLKANQYWEYSKVKPLISFRKEYGHMQMTGLRIKVHGTRLLNSIVKTIFKV